MRSPVLGLLSPFSSQKGETLGEGWGWSRRQVTETICNPKRKVLHSVGSPPLTVPKEEVAGALSGPKQPHGFTTLNRAEAGFTPAPSVQEGRESGGRAG